MFDALQEVISKLWDRVKLLDPKLEKHTLPSTFTKMVLEDEKLMSCERIHEKHQIPEIMAEYYYQMGPFFVMLRDYRDEITHSGKGFEVIFPTGRGFAVKRTAPPFSSLPIWKDQDALPNDLVSLRLAVAYVIHETLVSCEAFASTITSAIAFPPDIAPGYSLFIRGPHTPALRMLVKILEDEPWWN